MKKSLILIFLFFTTSVFSQNTDKKILEIRNHFSWINSQTDYKILILNDQDFVDQQTDDGAVAKGYFLDTILYKITTDIGGSTVEYITDYYFWNDKLIFVYARTLEYGYGADGIDYENSKTVYEGRFYYDDENCIKKIEKGANTTKLTSGGLLEEAQNLQLYFYVFFWNQDLYNKLQGKWVSEDDNLSTLEINGIVEDQYYEGSYLGSSRLLISNGYLYSFGIGNDEKSKYQIDKIDEQEMILLYLPVGSIVKYKKIKK